MLTSIINKAEIPGDFAYVKAKGPLNVQTYREMSIL